MSENSINRLNNQLLYLIIAILLVLSAFLAKFYFDQRKINNALRIKVLTMSKSRKTPTSWQKLIAPPKSLTTDTATKKPVENIIPTASTPLPPLETLDIQELALLLNTRMRNVKNQNLMELQQNIEIADQIISKDPDSFSAYKAKLVSLLIEEAKLKIDIDDGEVNSLLETMANFDLTTDKVAKKEAALISSTSNEIERRTEELNGFTFRRTQIEEQIDSLPPESPERQLLLIERINLLAREEESANTISNLQDTVAASDFPEEQYLNEDVVQIPFLRMMAKKDYDGVIDNASTFIEQYPNSVDGYYFLIKGLESAGRQSEVVDVIQNSRLSSNAQLVLQEKLRNSDNVNFSNYWEKLTF